MNSPARRDLARVLVELDVLEAQPALVGPAAGAPQDHPDARHQLLEAERLGHVVVAAGGEAAQLVLGGVARGQEDDRHVAALGAEPLGDLEALHVGQHHVEDHHLRPEALDGGQRLLARGRGRRLEALVAQGHGDHVDDVGLVVDDQDARGVRQTSRCPLSRRNLGETWEEPERTPRKLSSGSQRRLLASVASISPTTRSIPNGPVRAGSAPGVRQRSSPPRGSHAWRSRSRSAGRSRAGDSGGNARRDRARAAGLRPGCLRPQGQHRRRPAKVRQTATARSTAAAGSGKSRAAGNNRTAAIRHGAARRHGRFVATKEPADVGVGRLLRARTGRCRR